MKSYIEEQIKGMISYLLILRCKIKGQGEGKWTNKPMWCSIHYNIVL